VRTEHKTNPISPKEKTKLSCLVMSICVCVFDFTFFIINKLMRPKITFIYKSCNKQIISNIWRMINVVKWLLIIFIRQNIYSSWNYFYIIIVLDSFDNPGKWAGKMFITMLPLMQRNVFRYRSISTFSDSTFNLQSSWGFLQILINLSIYLLSLLI
jgi:hypothetical protein